MNMTLYTGFLEFISHHNLFNAKDKLLLAVSGGVDSVVLCELCDRAGFNFVIAHCNFQLRGKESDRDEQFVKMLGSKYETEVLVRKFNTKQYAENNKVSIQVAARALRYAWFAELVDVRESSDVNRESTAGPDSHRGQPAIVNPKLAADFIVTGHHLDDNIETIMMNFFKGTGIAGLRGMMPITGKLVRPLLFARKEEILSFAKEANLEFMEDTSNQSEKYSRNFFRLQVLPLIEKVYPEAMFNVANSIERFREIEMLYQQALKSHRKKLIENRGGETFIPVEKLRLSEPVQSITYDIIKDFGFTASQTGQVLALMDSETGRWVCSATHRILKNRNWLIISPLQAGDQSIVVINENDQDVRFINGQLEFKRFKKTAEYQPTVSTVVGCLDAKNIEFPILLRKWKKGDYFYPLGMQKKKKLARFFIDQKLSLNEKENIWVLEMNRKIIWVIGKRIDHRFRITDQTKEVLEISLKAL